MNLVKEKQGGLVPPGLKRWPLRGKFGHHDLISLNEDYPLSYRDKCCGLPGLVPPYCALLKYIGFIDLDLIVFRKLYIF